MLLLQGVLIVGDRLSRFTGAIMNIVVVPLYANADCLYRGHPDRRRLTECRIELGWMVDEKTPVHLIMLHFVFLDELSNQIDFQF